MGDRNNERLIEKYIDGSINSNDRANLLERMNNDRSLEKEFDLRKKLESIPAEREFYNLRKKLIIASVIASNQSVSVNSLDRIKIRKYLYYAAAFTGITIGGWAASSMFNKEMDPTKLYLDNFEPYPPVRVVRSGGELSSDSLFFRAMLAYQSGDYNSATIDFRKVLNGDPNANTIRFYLGISHMELLEFDKARECLEVVAESNSLFKDQALWYCGLSYLGERDIDKAKEILTKLSILESPISTKANVLLKEIADE